MEILTTILNDIIIPFMPTVLSVLSSLVLVIKTIEKLTTALKSEDFKECSAQTKELKNQIEELKKQNSMMLEQMSRVKGYAEAKANEIEHS